MSEGWLPGWVNNAGLHFINTSHSATTELTYNQTS